jgi:hypothetical protein
MREASEELCFGLDSKAKALGPRRYLDPARSPIPHAQGSGQAKEPGAPQRCANAGLHVIDDQGSFDANRDVLAIDRKLPTIKQPRRLPKQDAPEILEVLRLARSAIRRFSGA